MVSENNVSEKQIQLAHLNREMGQNWYPDKHGDFICGEYLGDRSAVGDSRFSSQLLISTGSSEVAVFVTDEIADVAAEQSLEVGDIVSIVLLKDKFHLCRSDF